MSIHKTRWGTYDVRYRDHEGRNRSRSFRKRAEAKAFDDAMKEIKRQGRAMEALKEAAGRILGLTDEERYDRDFEFFKKCGYVVCFIPDPNWRSGLRKRARAEGVRISTANHTDEHGRPETYMSAHNPDWVPTVPETEEQREARRNGTAPHLVQLAAAQRERDEWGRRGHLQAVVK